MKQVFIKSVDSETIDIISLVTEGNGRAQMNVRKLRNKASTEEIVAAITSLVPTVAGAIVWCDHKVLTYVLAKASDIADAIRVRYNIEKVGQAHTAAWQSIDAILEL